IGEKRTTFPPAQSISLKSDRLLSPSACIILSKARVVDPMVRLGDGRRTVTTAHAEVPSREIEVLCRKQT
ncbi:MAG TPA: hypothetical protein PKN13_10045, partial [Accumulibacter sp.]|nr:hypothetical protein [Accumulibacter sp.]